MRYLEKLLAAQRANNSWLCIGLDPQPEQLPIEALKWDEPVLPFTRRIIEATADLVCAYKPNLGFYMQWGAAGVIALERTIAAVPAHIPVILDAKIGDIGHTQAAWGRGLFDEWGVDAITVNPYVGADAVRPLLARRPDKAVYVLARTSNPGAPQFQGDLTAGEGLSAAVLRQASRWVGPDGGHCGFVVGATYPAELAAARALAPTASFLIPGIGAQGGDLAAAVGHGANDLAGPVINAGRSVLYASSGVDFAEKAREAAVRLRDEINARRQLAEVSPVSEY
ncbi:MAG: orotidine-5'-phosphate decarboxylase [Anaerolineae bacterium]|uniref:orotidine-5'-phosphate decarboxylase n=1 Tax=Promineifilum sp. TaxID=2664178 RepID=UPI001D8795FC|nr:orotidine-5'-phosphate decarboxylase [Anaerolineales bacterium]MCB8935955.1 orotidine-5'-phosphate decarboxylase [Promineifilum sp.]MCO5180105.1 orotidine-5'-phosphate decarboxylase [Promineifilum sp.]MCW5847463.1 orotidine-5'-phosphate decarboxylase [Anaerolineae bacterium]